MQPIHLTQYLVFKTILVMNNIINIGLFSFEFIFYNYSIYS
jgi:hypothetical protein